MVGASEMHGFRMSMEDQMTIKLELPNHKNIAFFGVYDGHAGDQASLYLSQHLWQRVNAMKDPTDHDELSKTVQAFDAEFLKLENQREHGSTCVFALVKHCDLGSNEKKWEVTVSNVGDSRAIIVRKDGTCVGLTEDHKPETPTEASRIYAAGGSVQMNRVNGQLAMSRAIGDWQYKTDSKLALDQQKVIAVPDITTEVLYEGDSLLVCCDGIVEQMSSEEAAQNVFAECKTDSEDPARVMYKLLEYSLERGSKDNHSAMLILPRDGTKYDTAKAEFVAGPFTPFQHDQSFVNAYMRDALKHGYSGAELKAMYEATEAGMDNLPVPEPRQQEPGQGMGGLLESILAQPGQESMREKLMMLTSMLQGGGGGGDGNMEDE
jgi:serine/threonine protein phosphatase PrpC